MKAASDVMLNKIVQKFKTLLNNHNHDGVYSNGARRVYNESWTEPQDSIPVANKDIKWYIVHIATSDDTTTGATVCVDWQMTPTYGGSVGFFYILGVDDGLALSDAFGTLGVTRYEDGSVSFQLLSTNSAHYIKRICGYI